MPWTDVLASDAVAPGAVVGVEVGSGRRVLWRTAAGRLAACDARCPHQWSDLAHEGVVDGEELVCLTHFWRFDTAGRGSKLAVTGRRDPKGDVPRVEVRELDGRIEVFVAEPPV
jgi:nitrite reductase/ring-hydroxylating ferredoxin subunit